MSDFAGVAPGVKLAVFDAGSSTGILTFPSNLNKRLFPPGYMAGARIFSNSWASNTAAYTYLDTGE
jgi:hypothetical protein